MCKCFSVVGMGTVIAHLLRAPVGVMCECFSNAGVGTVLKRATRPHRCGASRLAMRSGLEDRRCTQRQNKIAERTGCLGVFVLIKTRLSVMYKPVYFSEPCVGTWVPPLPLSLISLKPQQVDTSLV